MLGLASALLDPPTNKGHPARGAETSAAPGCNAMYNMQVQALLQARKLAARSAGLARWVGAACLGGFETKQCTTAKAAQQQ
jgi:hypothetical protein